MHPERLWMRVAPWCFLLCIGFHAELSLGDSCGREQCSLEEDHTSLIQEKLAVKRRAIDKEADDEDVDTLKSKIQAIDEQCEDKRERLRELQLLQQRSLLNKRVYGGNAEMKCDDNCKQAKEAAQKEGKEEHKNLQRAGQLSLMHAQIMRANVTTMKRMSGCKNGLRVKGGTCKLKIDTNPPNAFHLNIKPKNTSMLGFSAHAYAARTHSWRDEQRLSLFEKLERHRRWRGFSREHWDNIVYIKDDQHNFVRVPGEVSLLEFHNRLTNGEMGTRYNFTVWALAKCKKKSGGALDIINMLACQAEHAVQIVEKMTKEKPKVQAEYDAAEDKWADDGEKNDDEYEAEVDRIDDAYARNISNISQSYACATSKSFWGWLFGRRRRTPGSMPTSAFDHCVVKRKADTKIAGLRREAQKCLATTKKNKRKEEIDEVHHTAKAKLDTFTEKLDKAENQKYFMPKVLNLLEPLVAMAGPFAASQPAACKAAEKIGKDFIQDSYNKTKTELHSKATQELEKVGNQSGISWVSMDGLTEFFDKVKELVTIHNSTLRKKALINLLYEKIDPVVDSAEEKFWDLVFGFINPIKSAIKSLLIAAVGSIPFVGGALAAIVPVVVDGAFDVLRSIVSNFVHNLIVQPIKKLVINVIAAPIAWLLDKIDATGVVKKLEITFSTFQDLFKSASAMANCGSLASGQKVKGSDKAKKEAAKDPKWKEKLMDKTQKETREESAKSANITGKREAIVKNAKQGMKKHEKALEKQTAEDKKTAPTGKKAAKKLKKACKDNSWSSMMKSFTSWFR